MFVSLMKVHKFLKDRDPMQTPVKCPHIVEAKVEAYWMKEMDGGKNRAGEKGEKRD